MNEPKPPVMDELGPRNLEEMLDELAKHLVSLSKRLRAVIEALEDSHSDTNQLANGLTAYIKSTQTSKEEKGKN